MGEAAYQEQLTAPRRHGPAWGEAGPPPEAEAETATHGPLSRRAEAIVAVAIVVPVVSAYGAVVYGIYNAVTHI